MAGLAAQAENLRGQCEKSRNQVGRGSGENVSAFGLVAVDYAITGAYAGGAGEPIGIVGDALQEGVVDGGGEADGENGDGKIQVGAGVGGHTISGVKGGIANLRHVDR